MVLKSMTFFKALNFFTFYQKYMTKTVGAGAGADIFDKLVPEPHKNGPAPQHCL
jgi:hypothetical protein